MKNRGWRLGRRWLLMCLVAPVPAALAQNAIQNPGFDAGLDLWTIPRVSAFASQDAGTALHPIVDVNGYFQ